ncbi:MAG TPA: HEAT repeat domain-containing protein [Pirellulales bacterium]|jgi:HEAT repeat protein|nr:HEAT repeat domain-containing protein [Pirellulales bacterium]
MTTIERFTRGAMLLATLVVLCAAAARAAEKIEAPAAASDKDKERDLVKQLQTAAEPDKAMACKYLSIYGSAEAVPELAKLLGDEHLASWSRIALEAIPGPEADAALRNAISKLQGRLLVGTINSLGVRRDAAAVDALAAQLKSQDTEVAGAAAVALGSIGNAPATQALRQSLASAPPAVRSAIAQGCILCAERLLAEGKSAEAAKIYDELRKADLPKQRIIEATRGSILARKNEGIPLLVEQLRSSDRDSFRLGLSTARELPGPEVANALMAEVVGSSPDRAALMLYALADRNDTQMLPAVLEAASSGHKPVRIAAISILPRIGDTSCIAPLMKIAAGPDTELSAEAKRALAGLPGEKVNAEITSRLAAADKASLPMLLELVGLRRIQATDQLLKASDDPDTAVRNAAWTALGETVGPEQVTILIREVISPKRSDDAQVAQKALRAACVRMPERDACAGQLAAAMTGAPVATQCTLLEIMGSMGGAKALESLGSAAKSGDEPLQDAATRALGEWMNVEAGSVLLDLAKTLTTEKYQVRAMRGYIRLARQFASNDRQRVEMCQAAFDAAKRPAEQKLVLDILSRVPNVPALRLAVKASQNPELKDDATRAAKAIFDKLPNKTPEAQQLMAKLPTAAK